MQCIWLRKDHVVPDYFTWMLWHGLLSLSPKLGNSLNMFKSIIFWIDFLKLCFIKCIIFVWKWNLFKKCSRKPVQFKKHVQSYFIKLFLLCILFDVVCKHNFYSVNLCYIFLVLIKAQIICYTNRIWKITFKAAMLWVIQSLWSDQTLVCVYLGR